MGEAVFDSPGPALCFYEHLHPARDPIWLDDAQASAQVEHNVDAAILLVAESPTRAITTGTFRMNTALSEVPNLTCLPNGNVTMDRRSRGFARSVLGRVSLSRWNLDETFGLIGGDIMHGVMSLDQLWAARPILGYGRYRAYEILRDRSSLAGC